MKMATFEKRLVNAATHSRHVAEATVRRLARAPVHAGRSYLDVGCGNGLATLHVADALGLRCVGLDVDPEQIALARRAAGSRSDVSFVIGSVTELPFPTASFDIVATNKTMHHVPQWQLALAEIRRVIAPGGYLVFADLHAPLALAPLLRPAVGHLAGVFTRRDLDRGFSGLRDVYRRARWLHYEAVFVKP